MMKKALTLTELLIAIAIIALLVLILLPALARMRYCRYRAACANNLSQIGRAMLVYNDDYGDESIPRAGSLNSRWTGRIPNWQAKTRAEAYGLDANAPEISISATFYLLVKYAEVTPKSFLCKGDSGVKEFKPSDYGASGRDLVELWDFGPNPSDHVSYAYHLPYGPHPFRVSSPRGFAVAADRNPWLDAPGYKARSSRDFVYFDPNGPKKLVRRGNAIPHQGNGQNVLFNDLHIAFEKSSACAINNDNIYTSHNGPDIQRGTPPRLGSQPADPNDSLLVHDPPAVGRK